MRSDNLRASDLVRLAALTAVVGGLAACGGAEAADGQAGTEGPAPVAQVAAAPDTCSVWTERRGIIGAESPKIRRDGDQLFVWAGGEESGPGAEWYDVTGTPLNVAELQYGIGADAIPSIDIPLFVPANDARLLDLPVSPYRRCERPETIEEIMVIGYVAGGTARAYPTGLLDRHEVVNENTPDGKPFTVGW